MWIYFLIYERGRGKSFSFIATVLLFMLIESAKGKNLNFLSLAFVFLFLIFSLPIRNSKKFFTVLSLSPISRIPYSFFILPILISIFFFAYDVKVEPMILPISLLSFYSAYFGWIHKKEVVLDKVFGNLICVMFSNGDILRFLLSIGFFWILYPLLRIGLRYMFSLIYGVGEFLDDVILSLVSVLIVWLLL